MNKHKIVLGLIITLILGLAVFSYSKSDRVIADELLVSAFTSQGQATGKVLLQVPFVKTLSGNPLVNIAVDLDKDGQFASNEYLVTDLPAQPRADWRSGYYALAPQPIETGLAARVTVDKQNYEAVTEVATVEVGALFDLASVTDPENAMKGWGANIAWAQAEVVQITQEGVPDLDQQPAECAPTAAANSLIGLINKHGGEDLIPGDPLDFIENLKRHMNWTPENGVVPADFVAGKNRWAAAAGVPIRTTQAGDTHGLTTITAIREALQKGDAVELRLKFADAALESAGGHMVTVVGIHQGEGQTYLEINDPVTPNSGTEMVEVRQNTLVNYGPWEQVVGLSWAFVQTWEGHPTGTLLEPMTDEEIQGLRQWAGEAPVITVIEYQNNHIPVSQLRVGATHPPHEAGDGCPADHWHADGVARSVEGQTFNDPNGGGCGFGTLKERPTKDFTVPDLNQAEVEVRGLDSLRDR